MSISSEKQPNTLGSFDENRYEEIPFKKRRILGKTVALLSRTAVRKLTHTGLGNKLSYWKKLYLGQGNRRLK